MPWRFNDLGTIVDRVTGDIVTRLQDTTARVRFSFPWILARVLGGIAYDLYGFAQYLSRQIIPSTAEDDYLRAWLATYGLSWRAAAKARGFAFVQGSPGLTLPRRSILTRADGVTYETTMDVTLTLPGAHVPISALEPGTTGNTPGGTSLTLASPPAGFQPEASTTESHGLIGGSPTTKAAGGVTIQFSGAATISPGTILERLDGWRYRIIWGTAASAAGYRIVVVESLTYGVDGNAEPGTYLQVLSPPPNVLPDAEVTHDGCTRGADEETEAEARTRLLERLREPPHGGAAADYEAWTREVSSVPVEKVWAFGYPDVALPNVHVYFTVRGGPAPTAAQRNVVLAYLNTKKPMTALVSCPALVVETVNYRILNLVVASGYSVAQVRENIRAELNALHNKHELRSIPSQIENSKVHAAINRAAGVVSYNLADVDGGGPTANVSLDAWKFPVLGTVTWA